MILRKKATILRTVQFIKAFTWLRNTLIFLSIIFAISYFFHTITNFCNLLTWKANSFFSLETNCSSNLGTLTINILLEVTTTIWSTKLTNRIINCYSIPWTLKTLIIIFIAIFFLLNIKTLYFWNTFFIDPSTIKLNTTILILDMIAFFFNAWIVHDTIPTLFNTLYSI